MKEKDHIDLLIAKWKRECPQYDLAPVEVIGRAGRIMEYVDRALESRFEEFGITRPSFDVLATLRRSGPPYRLLQRDLMRQLMRTSGSISLRIDALQRAQLVTREQDHQDRRATYVVLSTRGSRLLDKVIPEHLENETRLLAGLTPHERRDLTLLLKKWLASLEEDIAGVNGAPIGVVVLSPRISASRRSAAGLPQVPGLLIHTVEEGSPAAIAGLRKGDLITAIEGLPISSRSAIRRAIANRRPKRKKIDLLRGSEPLSITLDRPDQPTEKP